MRRLPWLQARSNARSETATRADARARLPCLSASRGLSLVRTRRARADLIRKAIVATNKDGKCCPSNASAIQKFTILPRDFSSSTGELTPTLKTRRSEVEKANAALLDKLYNAKDDYLSAI
jgi:long-subunit acyl-CoA synthetase (AMP-forming)